MTKTENMIGTITQSERKYVILLALITTIVVMAPTLYGFVRNDTDHEYTGMHILSPADYPVYYSYIEQVKQGHAAFIDLYTSEPQSRIIINPFWLTIGMAAKVLNVSAPAAFHLARAFLIPLCVMVLYWFVSHLIEHPRDRRWATAWILTVSGVGFFAAPFLTHLRPSKMGEYLAPPDMWTGEANTFLTLLHSPHFIFSLICLLLFVIFLFRAAVSGQYRWSVLSGVVLLAWVSFHPFNVPTVFVLLFSFFITFSLIQKRLDYLSALKHALIVLSISTPTLLYYALLMNLDWLTIIRAYQNITLTPPLWLTLLGFGVLVPLAVMGWWNIWRTQSLRNSTVAFLLTWLPLHWLVIYLPVNFQRRITLGMHIVTALCAWFGLRWLIEYVKPRLTTLLRRIAGAALGCIAVLALIFSTLGNWLSEFDIIAKRMPHVYFSKSQHAAYRWLKAAAREHETILADPEWHGTILPGFTGRTVYAGHGVETAYYHCCKKPLLEWFFTRPMSAENRRAFLKRNNIDYVFVDTTRNREEIITQLADSAQLVFSMPPYTILRVNQ